MKSLIFTSLALMFVFTGCSSQSQPKTKSFSQEVCEEKGEKFIESLPYKYINVEFYQNSVIKKCFVKATLAENNNLYIIHRIFTTENETPMHSIYIDKNTGKVTGVFDSIKTMEEWNNSYKTLFNK